jgi:ABC-type glycerol-3-phosphate transport system substrate-binding protein
LEENLNMNKRFSLLMILLLALGMILVACGGGTTEPAAEEPLAEEPAAEEPAAEEACC